MNAVLAHVCEHVPGVIGALVASADGFTLAAELPADREIDVAGLSAMSAATLALSHQLVASCGETPAGVSHHVSNDGQVMIVPIAHLAMLTMLAAPDAEAGVIARAGHDAGNQLQRLFRGVATV